MLIIQTFQCFDIGVVQIGDAAAGLAPAQGEQILYMILSGVFLYDFALLQFCRINLGGGGGMGKCEDQYQGIIVHQQVLTAVWLTGDGWLKLLGEPAVQVPHQLIRVSIIAVIHCSSQYCKDAVRLEWAVQIGQPVQ